MTDSDITAARDKILQTILPDIAFEGWNWDALLSAAVKNGEKEDMVRALFPEKITDMLDHFADWDDREMLETLGNTAPETLRVRDRIKTAVETRLKILQPHKEAVRESAGFWATPFRQVRLAKIVWRSADRIWLWAGDTATDYNRYTKRGLLSGILTSVTLVWLNDRSDDMRKTREFLDRRIDNVLKIGGFLGKTIKKFKGEAA